VFFIEDDDRYRLNEEADRRDDKSSESEEGQRLL
jgi:hypothetical protein